MKGGDDVVGCIECSKFIFIFANLYQNSVACQPVGLMSNSPCIYTLYLLKKICILSLYSFYITSSLFNKYWSVCEWELASYHVRAAAAHVQRHNNSALEYLMFEIVRRRFIILLVLLKTGRYLSKWQGYNDWNKAGSNNNNYKDATWILLNWENGIVEEEKT